jgi:hypothetical protein
MEWKRGGEKCVEDLSRAYNKSSVACRCDQKEVPQQRKPTRSLRSEREEKCVGLLRPE